MTTVDEAIQRHLDAGNIPIRVGNRVRWIKRKQIVEQMRSDFEDRHALPEAEDDDDDR